MKSLGKLGTHVKVCLKVRRSALLQGEMVSPSSVWTGEAVRSFGCGKGHWGQTYRHEVSQGTGYEIINGCFFSVR